MAPSGVPLCRIIDSGSHARSLIWRSKGPSSDISAVCSNDQWDEVYKPGSPNSSPRTCSIALVFVNTRPHGGARRSHRLREQVLGEDSVASHHGSLSREIRLAAEEKLKKGELKAIVATASLELGIDVEVHRFGLPDRARRVPSPLFCSAWAAPATDWALFPRAASSR